MQFLAFASVAAILVVAGVGAASTLRGSKPAAVTTSEGSVTVPEPRRATQAKADAPKAQPVVQQAAPAPAPDTSAPPAAARPASRGGYVLVEGRTRLTDSIFAVRAGDSVMVNFDAYGYRTRRPAKLEQSLRLTLPMVFGRSATVSLDTAAAGSIVTSRDVVGELARDGMRVRLDNGAVAHIRVLTRIVSDGPIAVGYLTTIER